MTWLSALWTAFKASRAAQIALAVLVAAGAFLGFAAAQRAKGRAQERAKQNEQALENKKEAEQREREIESLPPDELDKRGKRWVVPD